MRKYRSMTAAALVAVTGTVAAWSISAASAQQEQTQPGQRPTTPPGQTRPTTPRLGGGSDERLFALEGAGAERKVEQLATRLSAIERQMEQTNQQLSQKVNQFNTLQGEQKVDAIAQCVQQIVNEHEQLHTYLVEIRTALTGEAGSEGVIPGREVRPGQPDRPGEPNRPGDTPRPSTPPGQTPPR
jgi:TolA-binding protein